MRQYFHKGLLWRSKDSGEVAAFELFIDLLYVGVIGAIGDTAIQNTTAVSLLHYVITYLMSWRMWADITMLVNMFETEDVVQRLSILLFLLCLVGFTVNIGNAFESSYTAMVAFYLGERMFQGVYFFWVAAQVPTVRGVMIFQSSLILVTTTIWVASVQVSYPRQLFLIFPALIIDVFGAMAIHYCMRAISRVSDAKSLTNVVGFLSSHFDFYPAFNIEHRVERNNTFVTLVYGYSVLGSFISKSEFDHRGKCDIWKSLSVTHPSLRI